MRLPPRVFDYLNENWRSIPQDSTSLAKLMIQQGWTDEVSLSDLQDWFSEKMKEQKS